MADDTRVRSDVRGNVLINALLFLFLIVLTSGRLKRDIFRSAQQLKQAINRFVTEASGSPKPFVWTADPRRVLAAAKRGK